MNVAGIYIDSLSVHSVWGVAGDNRLVNPHENYKSRDMILSLDDKVSPLQGHSFSRQGSQTHPFQPLSNYLKFEIYESLQVPRRRQI